MKKLFTLITSLLFCSLLANAQPQKVVLIEEGTGTWCQWCPRGDIYSQALADQYPGQYVFVAIHEGDPMVYQEYFDEAGLSALPSGNVDRTFGTGLNPFSDLPNDMTQALSVDPPAGVSVSTTWDSGTRDISMTVSADFVENLNGDYRLAAIVVEDGVTGPSPSYDQSNSYSGGANGPMGGYEDLPSPVPASIMVYNHVGRHLPGGYEGDANSLPGNINAGETHSYTYNWNLPSDYREDYVHVVGVLVNALNGQVLNAGRSDYLPGFSNGKPFFHSAPQTAGFEGIQYMYEIITHDPEHDALAITAISSLPAGLELEDLGEGKALLSGIPAEQGSFDITLNVFDGEWNIEQEFTLEIGAPAEDWVLIGDKGFSATEADLLDIEVNSLGEPYVLVTADNLFYLYKYTDEAWMLQGAAQPAASFHAALTIDENDVPYVFSDGVVSKFEGGIWEQVGADLPGPTVLFTDILASNGNLFLVYFNPPSTTKAYQFDGNSWVEAGNFTDGVGVWNRFSKGIDGHPIAIYGTDGTSIAYSEVAQWDGASWNVLGGNYVDPSSQTYFDHDVAVSPSGDVYAALTLGVGVQQLNIYKLVDDAWQMIGEDISGGATESCNLEVDGDGNLMIAFQDAANGGRTSVMRYDGANFTYMGLPGFTSIASRQGMAVDPEGIPFVVYRDADVADKASVRKYVDLTIGVSTSSVSGLPMSVFPNPTNGHLTIECKDGKAFEIISLEGELLQRGELNSAGIWHQQEIDLSNLPAACYIIRVIGDGQVGTARIVKW